MPAVLVVASLGPHEDAVQDVPQDRDEDDPEGIDRPVRRRRPAAPSLPATAGQLGPPLLALGSQGDAVLDAAAALEDVGVVGRGVALAGDVGGPELELGGQLGAARPLYVLAVVARAPVVAAHDVDPVPGAEGRGGDALQLGRGGDAAVGGLAVSAEGQGLDLLFGGLVWM